MMKKILCFITLWLILWGCNSWWTNEDIENNEQEIVVEEQEVIIEDTSEDTLTPDELELIESLLNETE